MNKRAIVVLGMHRSGTSALVRGIAALGVELGSRLMPAEPEQNAKGFFEDVDFVDLNDRLLHALGRSWHSLEPIAPGEWQLPALQPLAEEAAALLARRLDAHPLWGMKDPRLARLLPFWRPLFEKAGIAVACVIALRNPLSVARSLAVRNGFRAEKSYLLWLGHMLAAVRDSAGCPRVVVDYDDLLNRPLPAMERIAAAIGLPMDAVVQRAVADYAESFLSTELRHSAFEPEALRADPRAGELVVRAHDLLRRLARDEAAWPEEGGSFGEAWRALERAVAAAAGVFRYLDACEERIEALSLKPESAAPAAAELPSASPPEPPAPQAIAAPVQGRGRPDARLSVVIPLYNHEQYIEAALDSVLSQTVRPAQIVVVDDGSTDGSADKVRRLARQHEEIVFWSQPNRGAHHALNAALHRAGGEYVAILNSDDSFMPERLEACLDAFRQDPAIDAVATAAVFMDGQGRRIDSAWYEEARAFYDKEGDLPLALFHANFLLSTSNLFARRRLFEEVGYFAPLRYTHDLEFFLRLPLMGKRLHFIDQPLLAYRFHGENTIVENQARADVEQAAVFALFLHRLRRRAGSETAWRGLLARHVEVLGRRGYLDLVEDFLARLEDGPPGAADAPAAALLDLMARLGADWAQPRVEGSPLGEFVAARNLYLRRHERASADARVVAAFAEQARTIAGLRREFDEQARNIQQLRDEASRLYDVIGEKERALEIQAGEIRNSQAALAAKERELAATSGALTATSEALLGKERELAAIRDGNWYRLGEALRQKGLSLGRLGRIAYYLLACLAPLRWKPALRRAATRLREAGRRHAGPDLPPQPLRPAAPARSGRTRILHVIANFKLGGSSRLVVDLIERLGDACEHKVVTSHLPSPPAYAGVDVVEISSPGSPEELAAFLGDCDPAIVHVHYWGDVDWRWYDMFFRAAQASGCRVVENVNTPVEPYRAACVERYVYVSDYVREHFGRGGANELTIHPGSDLALFTRPDDQPLPPDCIGMVYRLEADKLDERSIDVFIKVAQRRLRTRALIVGGGTFLEPYRRAVKAAGVADSFEFTGYVDYARLPALYGRMSLFVAPVWKESFGQVGPFAMNMGIPVVGYAVGGLPEIVDDPSLLALPGDSGALAEIIAGLLDDPARCRRIGARNHARAQALFSVEAMAQAYRALYAELLGAPR